VDGSYGGKISGSPTRTPMGEKRRLSAIRVSVKKCVVRREARIETGGRAVVELQTGCRNLSMS
jgi:hypothetical protein